MQQAENVERVNQAPLHQMTALLLINPQSRQGGEADLEEGLRSLERAGITVIQVESHDARQSQREIAARHQEIDLVILGGGDGTISSTAGSLYRYQLPFAILPLGTANDLARSLGLPEDLPSACQAIIKNQRRAVDLGLVNGHYFFNAANIGLGVKITYELTPEVKKRWGVFSYLKAVISALSRKHTFRVVITADGKRHSMRSIQLAVGNGRFYGGGNIIDEQSAIDDGLLCLYSIKPQSLWELLTLAPLLRGGRQRRAKHTYCVSARKIEIKTRSPMEIHADGEPVSRTPAKFEVIPGALEVIAPASDNSTTPV